MLGPLQGRLFQAVDQTWREHMKKTFQDPAVLSVAQRPGFLEDLVEANDKLDVIQKGLNDYLKTKRLVSSARQMLNVARERGPVSLRGGKGRSK